MPGWNEPSGRAVLAKKVRKPARTSSGVDRRSPACVNAALNSMLRRQTAVRGWIIECIPFGICFAHAGRRRERSPCIGAGVHETETAAHDVRGVFILQAS